MLKDARTQQKLSQVPTPNPSEIKRQVAGLLTAAGKASALPSQKVCRVPSGCQERLSGDGSHDRGKLGDVLDDCEDTLQEEGEERPEHCCDVGAVLPRSAQKAGVQQSSESHLYQGTMGSICPMILMQTFLELPCLCTIDACFL